MNNKRLTPTRQQNEKAEQLVLSVLSNKQGLTLEELSLETKLPLFYLTNRLDKLRRDGKICNRKDIYYITPSTNVNEILLTFLLLLIGLGIGVNLF